LSGSPLLNKDLEFSEFYGDYFTQGFDCLISNSSQLPYCRHGYLFWIGYIISIITSQLALATLMKHKQAFNARKVFSFMVPVTVIVFLLACQTLKYQNIISVIEVYTPLDFVAILMATVGVILYNCSSEPPQKVLTEKF